MASDRGDPAADPNFIPMTPADAGLYLAGMAQVEARKSRRERNWGRYAELAAHMIQQAFDAGKASGAVAAGWEDLPKLPDDAAIEHMAAAAWAENLRSSGEFMAGHQMPAWGAAGEERLWDDWRNMMRAAVASLFPPEALRQLLLVQRHFRCAPCAEADPENAPEAIVDGADLEAVDQVMCPRCGKAMGEVLNHG